MITYFVYGKATQERLGLSHVMSTNKKLGITSHHPADYIFEIRDKKVISIKDRFNNLNKFSEEDIAVMILSAVPM